MWIIADYEATTLFSLKPATATVSGGKTLLVPTPFAIKMALLDVVCRLEGQASGERIWDRWLAGLRVALRPAEAVVVNHTVIKLLKPRRHPARPGTQHAGYFQQTISYREYAQLVGSLGIALEADQDAETGRLAQWLLRINYLGKRGSFFQLQAAPRASEALPAGFIVVSRDMDTMSLDALLTQLDDVGEGLTFARANIYSPLGIRVGKQRALRQVALPYRLVSSSRGYSYYRLVRETG